MSDIIAIVSEKIKNKTTILVIVFIFLLLMILGATFLLTNKQTIPGNTRQVLPQPSNQPVKKTSSAPPDIKLANVTVNTPLPDLPKNLTRYQLKTHFSADEAKVVGKKLGLTGDKLAKNNRTFFMWNEADNNLYRSLLIFDLENGSFAFTNKGNYQFPFTVTSSTPATTANKYLTYLGLNEQEITCNQTYKKRDDDARVTYVECHRDWEQIGAPILSSIGVLNVAENKRLNTLKLADPTEALGMDSSIIATSNHTDGKARLSDFNTITLGIEDKTGTLLSVASNLRWIDKKISIEASRVLTPQQALDRFISQNYDSLIVLPAGAGSVKSDKIFPNNEGKALSTQVTDYLLYYPEKPLTATQDYLTPSYLIRGTAKLESGYLVKFSETIPVTSSPLSFNKRSLSQVAGTTSTDSQPGDNGQKQGTFQFITPTPTLTLTPTPTPCPPGTILSAGSCIPIQWTVPSPTPTTPNPGEPTDTPPPPEPNPTVPPCSDTCGICLTDVQSIDGATIGINPEDNQYYIIPSSTDPITIQNQINALMEQIGDDPHHPLRDRIDTLIEWLSSLTTSNGCPQRVTGPSPSLFVYAPQGTSLTIEPQFALTYLDPPLINSVWNVEIERDSQMKVNNISRPYIYYEYKHQPIGRPEKGWVISKKGIGQLVNNISIKLQLTKGESDRLLFELSHGASDANSDTLFVGLVSQESINTALPLNIIPSPKFIYRYHFFISSRIPEKLARPQLSPVTRSDFEVIEFGAFYQD